MYVSKIAILLLKNAYLSFVKWESLSAFLLVAGTFCITTMQAQSIVEPKQIQESTLGVLYNKERVFELRLHTNGGAMSMQFGKIVTYYKTNYYQFDFGWVKHPKEYKQSITFNSGNPFTQSSNSFTYGKQNQLLVLRGGIGRKIYFSDKAKRKGVAVGIDYEFGASIGILKPYYLKLNRIEDNGFDDYISTERYSEDNKDVFLDNTKIIGPASFFKGFGNISAMPGLHARVSTHFSVGAFDEYVKAFEMGVMIDGYFQRVPIMIIDNNSPVFINAFLAFQIGKRS